MIGGLAFDSITLDDIQLLIDRRIPEGRSIEYKADHYGRTEADKREFAADICALANAGGGDLLIGVQSEQGIPISKDGVIVANPDELKLSIQQSIRHGLDPELIDLRVNWLPIAANNGVLLIRVPRSRHAPHRVKARQDWQFYMRNENGKYAMSISEIRDRFLLSASVDERILEFRKQRSDMVARNEYLVQTPADVPHLLFHLIPRQSFTELIDIHPTHETSTITPLGASGANYFHSLDGPVFYAGEWTKDSPVGSSTTVFRNGIIEAARPLATYERHERSFLQLNAVERDLIRGLPPMIRIVKGAGLQVPYYLCLSLLNIKSLAGRYSREDSDGLFFPYRQQNLSLPAIEVTEPDMNPAHVLRPLFDLLWNAFGQPGSPNFKRDGQWSLDS